MQHSDIIIHHVTLLRLPDAPAHRHLPDIVRAKGQRKALLTSCSFYLPLPVIPVISVLFEETLVTLVTWNKERQAACHRAALNDDLS